MYKLDATYTNSTTAYIVKRACDLGVHLLANKSVADCTESYAAMMDLFDGAEYRKMVAELHTLALAARALEI